jgi:fatty-acid desaturase
MSAHDAINEARKLVLLNVPVSELFSFCILVFVFYLWHTFGVTLGLHRLLSHRAFSCPKFVEYFWVFGAYLAYHGSPIWWATIHRAHHRHVESELDPHSPKNGIFKAYSFFAPFEYPSHIDPAKQSPDLLKDPIYAFLEQNGNWRTGYLLNVVICFLFRIVLFLCFGWTVALASLTAGIIALNVPLILNIICHMPRLGYKNYAITDDSVNVWWMAVIGLGDGWHNNHHAHPGSSQMGLRKHEIDISYLLLRALKRIGLVHTINESMHANSNASP